MIIKKGVPLAPHTIFNIGGQAKYFAEAGSREELSESLEWAKQRSLPVFILGGGSNVLVSDKGFDGLVIKISGMRNIEFKNGLARADAGSGMSQLVAFSVSHNLSGIEWAIGIPGTLGGSIRGNAGCFGGEMKDVVKMVEVFDAARGRLEIGDRDCGFGYRESVFKHNPQWVIVGAELKLLPGNSPVSEELIRQYSMKRVSAQDIGASCAGCVFKNMPWKRKDIHKTDLLERFTELNELKASPNIPAGFLLDRCGLKGVSAGGAAISEKHANYFINRGGATAEEILQLIFLAKERVFKKYGILLEEEIQKIGFD